MFEVGGDFFVETDFHRCFIWRFGGGWKMQGMGMKVEGRENTRGRWCIECEPGV